MSSGRRLGVLGGTFDPVHYGHLDAAEAAQRTFELDEVWLIPSHVPPHRPHEPVASPFHRFAMAALAIAGRPRLLLSDLELGRRGPTFTVDTLRALHDLGWTRTQIFFILGTDAFAEIASWHEYPSVLDAAHFVVIARPGTSVDVAAARTPALRPRMSVDAARSDASDSTRIILVPAHTRDIASTAIRERLRAGARIHDLVPPAVERHILTHHLYGAVDDLHGKSEGSIS